MSTGCVLCHSSAKESKSLDHAQQCGLYEDMSDHRSPTHSSEIKPEKKIQAWRDSTHELCVTGAVLYQLSYQANWELATLWVRIIPVEGDDNANEYMKDCIFQLRRNKLIVD